MKLVFVLVYVLNGNEVPLNIYYSEQECKEQAVVVADLAQLPHNNYKCVQSWGQ